MGLLVIVMFAWIGRLPTVVFVVILALLLAGLHTVKADAKTRHTTRHHVVKHKRHSVQYIRMRKRLRAVRYVKSKLGNPYRWGATGPYAYDCSGLMLAAYRSVGKRIPRTTYAQLHYMPYHRNLHKGDLVFRGSHHVGMYVGNGRVIHAPHAGARVRYAPLRYFRSGHRSAW